MRKVSSNSTTVSLRSLTRRLSFCAYLKSPPGSICFTDDYCFEFYLRRLMARSPGFGVQLHAWTLMPDECFVLASPQTSKALKAWIGSVNLCFGEYFQQRYQRPVRIFPKLKAVSPILGDVSFLNCQKFIEREGARRSGFNHPGEHHWSSYSRHAFGVVNDARLNSDAVRSGYSAHRAMRESFGAGRQGLRTYRKFIAKRFSQPCEHYLRVSLTHGKVLGRVPQRLESAKQ